MNAQSDAFFSYQYECRESDEWGELLILPPEHGLDYSYPADNVAMGTGLLVMTGFAMIYANTRKRK